MKPQPGEFAARYYPHRAQPNVSSGRQEPRGLWIEVLHPDTLCDHLQHPRSAADASAPCLTSHETVRPALFGFLPLSELSYLRCLSGFPLARRVGSTRR